MIEGKSWYVSLHELWCAVSSSCDEGVQNRSRHAIGIAKDHEGKESETGTAGIYGTSR